VAPRTTPTAGAPRVMRAPVDVNEIAAVRAGGAPARKGKVLMLLPENGSDPSETAIPYAMLKAAGYDVVFATASGKASKVDTLSFRSPFLRTVRPDAEGKADYRELVNSKEFKQPITFDAALKRDDFAALYVPGGEGKGMPKFLSNARAHDLVRKFYEQKLPAAFLCHGALMAARTIDAKTGKSVLRGEKATTIPKAAEMLAVPAFIASGRPRVYGALGGNWAAEEVRKAVGNGNFVEPDFSISFRNENDATNVVATGNHLFGSSPWDSKPFAHAFVELLNASRG
jgi:putative intracellular protease/amidase